MGMRSEGWSWDGAVRRHGVRCVRFGNDMAFGMGFLKSWLFSPGWLTPKEHCLDRVAGQ